MYLNCITVSRPYPADEDDVFKQTYIGLGREFIENEVSTLFALDSLDTAIVTCRIKRKFLRRKLLYFSNGTESFNPVKIQIILCGDVHPNPGPNSRQNQNHQPGKDPEPAKCSVCAKKIVRNHRAMCCDQCELWFHMRCGQMTLSDYNRYRNKQQFNWICPACLRSVLSPIYTSNFSLTSFP